MHVVAALKEHISNHGMLAKSGNVQAVRKYLEQLRSLEIAVRELLGSR